MSAEGLSFCKCSACWVLNSLKLVMMGLKDSINWLDSCYEILLDIDEAKRMGKAFTILEKYGEKLNLQKDVAPLTRKKLSKTQSMH
jgi:hypothetical protein